MTLLNGDCLELMQQIPDKSIDCVITDPPYGTTACKWDSVIPFEPMWKELNRIIKDNGAIVLFGSEPFSSALRMSNIKNYRYDWIWDKLRGMNFANSHKMPMKSHEIISIFYSKLPTYNPQMRKGKPYKVKEGMRKNGLDFMSGDKGFSLDSKSNIASFIRSETNNKGERFPLSILQFGKSCKGVHPTQKPTELLEYLIKTYTQENETVLDFTMGSGSTGVACVNTNRNFWGIEKDSHYFTIAKERIEEAQKQRNEMLFDAGV